MKTSSGSSPSGLRLAGLEQAIAKLDSQAPALQQIQDRLGQRATRFEGASGATNVSEMTLVIGRPWRAAQAPVKTPRYPPVTTSSCKPRGGGW